VTTAHHRGKVDRAAVGAVALRSIEGGDSELGWHLARALGVGADPGGTWRVVLGRMNQAVSQATDLAARLAGYPDVLAHADASTCTVVAASERLDEVVDRFVEAGFACGFSSAAPAEELSHAFVEARRALRVASTNAGGGAVGPGEITGRGPLSTVTPEQAEAARGYLDPLLSAPRGALLLDTVHAWLDVHGHWDRAAHELGVHRHTVKSRVGQAFGVLGTSPDSPRDRFELWFALQATTPEA
jgi:DNA-binding PucR family transcriptional regulator